jgi:1-phosphofructokinase family hexose kinase
MRQAMPKVLAVTPNPAIDRILHVPHLAVSAVHRATQVERVPSGKGVNIVRAVQTLGGEAIATGPLAGYTGRMLADMAEAEGLTAGWYWLRSGETRYTILMTHQGQDATVINEPGPLIGPDDWLEIAAHIRRLADQCEAVTFSGSLPPGITPEAFCDLACSLVLPGRNVYLDTSGEALALALAEPGGLCIKVNRWELAAGLGQTLVEPYEVIKAGQRVLARGASMVVVTLGREGALAITPQGCRQASTPPVEVINSVGSGDSLLAGLVVALLRKQPITEALALGVACGAVNAMSHLPGQFDYQVVEELLAQVETKEII